MKIESRVGISLVLLILVGSMPFSGVIDAFAKSRASGPQTSYLDITKASTTVTGTKSKMTRLDITVDEEIPTKMARTPGKPVIFFGWAAQEGLFIVAKHPKTNDNPNSQQTNKWHSHLVQYGAMQDLDGIDLLCVQSVADPTNKGLRVVGQTIALNLPIGDVNPATATVNLNGETLTFDAISGYMVVSDDCPSGLEIIVEDAVTFK